MDGRRHFVPPLKTNVNGGGRTTMGKVYVIARCVVYEGRENQLRILLQGMLTPTRAESGCELFELYESDSSGRF